MQHFEEKKLGEKLVKHEESNCHVEAVARWSAAKEADVTGTVLNKLEIQRKQQIVRNREALSTLIRAVLFCARQSIALRGHRESKQSDAKKCINRDNFVELCHLMELENPYIARRLNALPANAQYTSKQSQEDLIQSAATVIKKKDIVQEVI